MSTDWPVRAQALLTWANVGAGAHARQHPRGREREHPDDHRALHPVREPAADRRAVLSGSRVIGRRCYRRDVSGQPFGPLLRGLRETAGLSQEALAERAQLSTRTVSDLERGIHHTARRYTAELLAAALDLDGQPRAVFLSAAAGRPARVEPVGSGADLLLGRDDDIRAAAAALTSGPGLVTVTGPGGVGKTRLAAELQAQLSQQWDDGSRFVDLGVLTDPDLVAPVVAAAVSVPSGGDPPLLALSNHLRTRHLLLVLDNAEHVLAAVAELTSVVLEAATAVTVLVTSRAPLRLGRERVLPLGPLAVSAAVDAASPAAELFALRARSANPSWQGSAADAAAISEICRRLDGLPLAIELAAAHTRLLSPTDLLDRLDLDVLAVRRSDLPARQRTMRALIGWSYDLLSPAEQAVFEAVSVFRGSWDVRAAEHVVGRGCLDELEALLEANLLLSPAAIGTPRLRMLDTISHFAAERLASGPDAADYRSRHVDWCVDVAAEGAERLTGPEQGEWLRRLDLEHNNLRAALAEAMRIDGDGRADRLAAYLWRFWYLRGHLSEGSRWIDQVLARTGVDDVAVTAARCKARYGAGVLAWMQGHNTEAEGHAQSACEGLLELGELTLAAHAVNLLGMIAQYRGQHQLAADRFTEALDTGRQTGDRRTVAVSLINIGALATDQGDEAVAERSLRESVEAFRELGDGRSEADVLGTLSDLAARQGRFAEAADLLELALATFVALGDRTGENEARQSLGRLHGLRGDVVGAAAQWEAVLVLSADLGDPWGRAAARTGLAELAEADGDHAAADRFQHALDLHRDLDHQQGVVACLEGLIRIAEAGGGDDDAHRWRDELRRSSG